jgi:hypothetical protein
LAVYGLVPSDVEVTVEVWPDNADAVGLFSRLLTQWRVSHAGPYGLDYGCVPDVLRLMGFARSQWPALFDDLRVMEDAALAKMREGKK